MLIGDKLNEGVAFLLVHTSMSLTEIRELEPDELMTLIHEVVYQVRLADYKASSNAAMVACTVANVNRRKGSAAHHIHQLIGHPPQREVEREDAEESITREAERVGIQLPEDKGEED